jgi:hypothetical protein
VETVYLMLEKFAMTEILNQVMDVLVLVKLKQGMNVILLDKLVLAHLLGFK